ncbi:MAG: CMP/dCMP kinase [Acidobacteriota bacterium]|jgi:cytidylate kinase|nr:CMP/dCMP kinase [Acidobacteriota bacterium]
MSATSQEPLIVAIDGPSGVGKTTASRLVASALHLPHIDTGAMYRAIALAAKRAGVALDDEPKLDALASAATIDFTPGERARVLLDGEDVTDFIRTPEMSMAASHVSAVPAVRRVLVRLQQAMGRRKGGVLEGRDIGTKVFPETPHKFFLTARPEVRAQRRYRELLAKGTATDLQQVLAETIQRDTQDSTRADSPLSFDDSYTVIDTSDRSIEEVVEAIAGHVSARSGNRSAGLP